MNRLSGQWIRKMITTVQKGFQMKIFSIYS